MCIRDSLMSLWHKRKRLFNFMRPIFRNFTTLYDEFLAHLLKAVTMPKQAETT